MKPPNDDLRPINRAFSGFDRRSGWLSPNPPQPLSEHGYALNLSVMGSNISRGQDELRRRDRKAIRDTGNGDLLGGCYSGIERVCYRQPLQPGMIRIAGLQCLYKARPVRRNREVEQVRWTAAVR